MRKKRILFFSEATFLNTGYATYAREILTYLHNTGKYEIAELASYGAPDDPRSLDIPWGYYGAALSSNATQEETELFKSKPTYQFGEYRFPSVCLSFKPDIVCDIRDFWMLEFAQRSPYRPFYKWCIMPTVDAAPQARQWINAYQEADACLSYSDWAGDVLKKQTNNNINYIGSAPPSAHPAYNLVEDKAVSRKSMGIPENKKVIGTVMRNQRRKLYPDLFQSFRMLLDRVDDPENYILYCHTSYPDMGWDLPELIQEYGLSSYTMFTYVCRSTKKPFCSHFTGPTAVSPYTKKYDGIIANVKSGLSYADLATLMNCFDIYVQYANSEGFGLPQVEAAACGVPVASINYSAMESVVKQLGAIPLEPKALYKEMETGCMRAVPNNEDTATKLIEFFKNPSPVRKQLGFKVRQNFLQHFQWDKSGAVWEKYFDSISIPDEKDTWLSKPDIQQPTPKQDPNGFQSFDHMATFLINDVLKKPEMINSMLYARLVRDLMYGYTTSHVDGVYQNENSMITDGRKAAASFNYDTAYENVLHMRNYINLLETRRAEAFDLK